MVPRGAGHKVALRPEAWLLSCCTPGPKRTRHPARRQYHSDPIWSSKQVQTHRRKVTVHGDRDSKRQPQGRTREDVFANRSKSSRHSTIITLWFPVAHALHVLRRCIWSRDSRPWPQGPWTHRWPQLAQRNNDEFSCDRQGSRPLDIRPLGVGARHTTLRTVVSLVLRSCSGLCRSRHITHLPSVMHLVPSPSPRASIQLRVSGPKL
jgi:hypothetical protein